MVNACDSTTNQAVDPVAPRPASSHGTVYTTRFHNCGSYKWWASQLPCSHSTYQPVVRKSQHGIMLMPGSLSLCLRVPCAEYG